jgi:hypothetical protein
LSYLIPDDFFDTLPPHINKTDEDTLNDKYNFRPGYHCSPGWHFTPAKDVGQVHFLSCKRRSCPKCGKYWAWKWRKMLEDKAMSLQRQGLSPMRRALTLTTAYDPGFERMRIALSMFWKELRKIRPGIQYWGVTEYNQAQTQPHFHFILGNDSYIPQKTLQELWVKVQRWAGFQHIAWVVRIEKIRDGSNIMQYFTKYLTKLTGGKNEIPDREKWKGRFVRYSKSFFAFPTQTILASIALNEAIAKDDHWKTYYQIRPKLIMDYRQQDKFVEQCQSSESRHSQFINSEWDPDKDRERGNYLSTPVDNQLTLW